MKLISWNVNSLRSCEEKFLRFVSKYKPEVVAIQELRAHEDQISFFLKNIPGYNYVFNDSGRSGYGGTALFYKSDLPDTEVSKRTGNDVLDSEGRVIRLKIGDLNFFNFYVPNGNSSPDRLAFKMRYYAEMHNYLKKLIDQGEQVIVGADLNVAHTHLDVYLKYSNDTPRVPLVSKLPALPVVSSSRSSPTGKTSFAGTASSPGIKHGKNNSGFLPEERAWFDNMLQLGLFDSFRHFYPEQAGHYSWWSMRDPTRATNKGWRYDYFLLSNNLKEKIKAAGIMKEVYGSDHCPVWVEILL